MMIQEMFCDSEKEIEKMKEKELKITVYEPTKIKLKNGEIGTKREYRIGSKTMQILCVKKENCIEVESQAYERKLNEIKKIKDEDELKRYLEEKTSQFEKSVREKMTIQDHYNLKRGELDVEDFVYKSKLLASVFENAGFETKIVVGDIELKYEGNNFGIIEEVSETIYRIRLENDLDIITGEFVFVLGKSPLLKMRNMAMQLSKIARTRSFQGIPYKELRGSLRIPGVELTECFINVRMFDSKTFEQELTVVYQNKEGYKKTMMLKNKNGLSGQLFFVDGKFARNFGEAYRELKKRLNK